MIAAAAPFLMFTGRCEEALTFYVATIPGARIVSLDKKPDGTVAMARLAIAGLEILANDSPPVHDFDFNALDLDLPDGGHGRGRRRPGGEAGRGRQAAHAGQRLRLFAAVRLGPGPLRRVVADQFTIGWGASA